MADFNNLSDRYDDWFSRNNLICESEMNALRQIFPEFKKAVEIGVGTGILQKP